MIFLFDNMVKTAILSSVFITSILILRKIFFSKLNIKILCFLWIFVLIRLIVPITFESSINIGGILPEVDINIIENNVSNDNTVDDSIASNGYTYIGTENTYDTTLSNDIDKNKYQTLLSTNKINNIFQINNLKQILICIWILGMLLSIVYKGKHIYVFTRKIILSRIVLNLELNKILNTNISKLNIKRKIVLYECSYIDAPLTCGVFKPKILLPVGFSDALKEEQQSLIILHELFHIKNYDVIKNYLWLAARIIYWFNPLISFAYKAYVQDSEVLCDSFVINTFSSNNCKLYSQSLIDVVKLSKGETKLPIALSFCEDKSTIRKRVEYMIKPTKKFWSAAVVSLSIAVMLIFACFTTACIPKLSSDEISFLDETIHIDHEIQASSDVKVTVNADVAYPEDRTIPIFNVEPANITAKQFNTFIDYVFNNTPVYYSDIKPYYIDKKHGIGDIYDGTIAPLGEYSYSVTGLKAFTEDGKESFIELVQSPGARRSQFTYWRFDDGHYWDDISVYQGEEISNMEKSYVECLNTAQSLIDEFIGKNNNFELYDTLVHTSETVNPAYRFYFRKEYNGIPAGVHCLDVYGIDLDEYNFLSDEYTYIIVDDEGIFEVFWSGPTIEKKEVNTNAEFLAFDIIMDEFNKFCENKSEWYPYSLQEDKVVTAIEIAINDIELCLVPIAEYNEKTNSEIVKLPYKLIPVWNFKGDVTFTTKTDNSNSEKLTMSNLSVVSIIAVDDVDYE